MSASEQARRPGSSSPTSVRVAGVTTSADRPVTGNTRGFGGAERPRPVHRSMDKRYHRPSHRVVVTHPHAGYAPPARWSYRPYYTRWYCHPWYRYRYATTVVVGFGFVTYAWTSQWAPPHRTGWVWVPGYSMYGYWHPGHWSPVAPAPVHYVYVPGWWDNEVYVEGYYRKDGRDGWAWVSGEYLDDGTYIPGHWIPEGSAPEGYLWESGFFDGEAWIDGFWRPEYRAGHQWLSAYFDADGIYNSGYWLPLEERLDHVWVPGWFDGTQWVEGYWLHEDEVTEEAFEAWSPEDGFDDGWENGAGWGDGEVLKNQSPQGVELDGEFGDAPLALPVPD